MQAICLAPSTSSQMQHPFKGEVLEYFNRAQAQLPSTITNPAEQEAWVARRTIELSEGNVSKTRALQALLLSWIYEQNIWLNHPEKPDTFRDFLKSIGSEQEGNMLSPSAISDFNTVAEVIAPYCNHADIPIRQAITGKNWSKFRVGIPAMRRAIEEDDDPQPVIESVVADVKALPSRSAMREKYQKPRDDKIGVGDSLHRDDKVHVHLVIDGDEWPTLKSQLSRKVDWEVMMLQSDVEVRIPLEDE
ncbi:hypothetical protein GF348_24240 [candidate division KSB3 bacterium]|nr:hypothetical protein [candidate division KSB3 bacterium]